MRKKIVKKVGPPRSKLSSINNESYNSNIDTLLYKVDKIEEVTGLSMSKIEAMNNLLYDPEHGIFSRVKSVENSSEIISRNENNINIMKSDIRDIILWKNKVISIAKWIIVTVAGAAITLIIKLVYDYLNGHVVIN